MIPKCIHFILKLKTKLITTKAVIKTHNINIHRFVIKQRPHLLVTKSPLPYENSELSRFHLFLE